MTQRPSDPEIQRPGDPVDPVTLFYNELQMGALKMHDLKMTDKENYGSGKCRTGK